MRELKLHCGLVGTDGSAKTPNCKVAFIIDGVNVLFQPKTLIPKTVAKLKYPNPEYIEDCADFDEMSVFYNLKKMLR